MKTRFTLCSLFLALLFWPLVACAQVTISPPRLPSPPLTTNCIVYYTGTVFACSTSVGGSVDDTAYDASSWNGVTTIAPSKNAVRDKIEALIAGGGLGTADIDTCGELSTILGTDVTGTCGKFVLSASPTFTGHVTVESVTATGATGTGKFVFDTAPQMSTIELGAASDTTLSRSAAGIIQVEGVTVATASNTVTFTNKSMSEAQLTFTDITTGNVSTSNHGFVPKLINDATKYLDSTGAYTVPAGSGGISGADTRVVFFDGSNNPAGDAGFTYNKATDSATLVGSLTVADDAYDDTSWNGNATVPTKNAIRDFLTTVLALPFSDANSIVKGSVDGTKELRFEVDGFTTGTVRVITAPNADTTIPIITQQLTFTGPTAARSIALPDAAFTVARSDAAQTFTGTQQFSQIDVNNADTSITRVSAGVVAIEGVNIVTAGAVTGSGLTQATGKLLGRSTASTGAIEEITVGSGLSLSGGTLTSSGGGGLTTTDLGADVTHTSGGASWEDVMTIATLSTSTTYHVLCTGAVTSGGSNSLYWALSGPSSPTRLIINAGYSESDSGAMRYGTATAYDTMNNLTSVTGTVTRPMRLEAVIVNNASGGALKLRQYGGTGQQQITKAGTSCSIW